ncbi:MAG: outer membrane protein assembly factor BamD [Sedimentisphaerales bacterium]|nr:outer membrane protein assembly factor BamD [Sedimentisphaerales bacterium]
MVFVTALLAWMVLPAGRIGLCADLPAPAGSKQGSGAKTETWRLDEQGQWKATAGNKEEEFLLRLSEVKKLVDEGKPDKVKKAAKKLKTDFPEIAGEDFNAFIAAEVFLAKGKLDRAVKGYEKLLDDYPKSGLREATLEREFAIASDFLAGRKKMILPLLSVRCYDEGIKIMEKISDRTGGAEIAKRALYAAVKSYESRKKFNEAYLTWSQISIRWPAGQAAKDTLLGMARNKYATYRGPQFDASGLISAKSYYENFRLRYPQEAQIQKVDEILERIDEQLAEKILHIAHYYSRTGSELPANMYNQMVVDNWPETKAAESARQSMIQK